MADLAEMVRRLERPSSSLGGSKADYPFPPVPPPQNRFEAFVADSAAALDAATSPPPPAPAPAPAPAAAPPAAAASVAAEEPVWGAAAAEEPAPPPPPMSPPTFTRSPSQSSG